MQKTCFWSSCFLTVKFNDETVLKRHPSGLISDDEWLVMFSDDMNHWMFADGLQADVVQIKFICRSAITVIGCSGNKVTDVTGTVSIEIALGNLL